MFITCKIFAFVTMSTDLRKTLINELSELSLSLSDGLERIGELDIGEFDTDHSAESNDEADSAVSIKNTTDQ